VSVTQWQLEVPEHWPVPQQSLHRFSPLAQLEQLHTHEPHATVSVGQPLEPSAAQVTLCPVRQLLGGVREPLQPASQARPEQLHTSA